VKDLGQQFRLAYLTVIAGRIEVLAGDLTLAEGKFRDAHDQLEQIGERGLLATVCAELAEVLGMLGRIEDAAEMANKSESLSVAEDVESEIRWRIARARVIAGQGDLATANALATEAVGRAAQIEFPNLEAAARLAQAEILLEAGEEDLAGAGASEVVELYESKGNVVDATRAAALVADRSGV
jgi:ATP/maltotriose-dependent transcriptional regulator MalT